MKNKKEWLLPLALSLVLALISAGQLYTQYINDMQNKEISILKEDNKINIIDKTKMSKDIEYIKEIVTALYKIMKEKIVVRYNYGL